MALMPSSMVPCSIGVCLVFIGILAGAQAAYQETPPAVRAYLKPLYEVLWA